MYIEKQEDLYEGKFAGKDIDKVVFGPDVDYIPENCFNGCKNLKEIIFKGNINNVEAAAFMNCNNLKIINANNIGIIKDFAFYGCDNIVNFNINEDNANNIIYGTNNNILFEYFLLPKIGTPLNDISWRKINMISKQNKAKNYFKVGDEKELQIGSETYHVQILGFNHDDKSDGSGKAGITVGLKEIITTEYNMNSTYINIGGWQNSKMRTYLQTDIYNSLPNDVKLVIKTVDKASDVGNKDEKTLVITHDNLFLFSFEEVGFKSANATWFTSSSKKEKPYVPKQGIKYDFFINDTSRIKYLDNSATRWWLRSTFIYNNSSFYIVKRNGNNNINFANNNNGIVFGFAI